MSDAEMTAAVRLVLAKLDAYVLELEPCEYPRCKRKGPRYKHGVWCDEHVFKMERIG